MINLLVLRVVPGIHYDAICYSSAAVVDLQCRRSVSIGVIGLRVNLREHPLAEFSEFGKVSAKARFTGEQEGLNVGVERDHKVIDTRLFQCRSRSRS
jgi:hypothetical protein